jgi:hypothetical protein
MMTRVLAALLGVAVAISAPPSFGGYYAVVTTAGQGDAAHAQEFVLRLERERDSVGVSPANGTENRRTRVTWFSGYLATELGDLSGCLSRPRHPTLHVDVAIARSATVGELTSRRIWMPRIARLNDAIRAMAIPDVASGTLFVDGAAALVSTGDATHRITMTWVPLDTLNRAAPTCTLP